MLSHVDKLMNRIELWFIGKFCSLLSAILSFLQLYSNILDISQPLWKIIVADTFKMFNDCEL